MPSFTNAALCGFVGAIAAYGTYVQSNLYILGDAIRRGRHPLWDPVAFALMGLVAGITVGVVTARFLAASPLKSILVGLGTTLLGIAVVGGVSTLSRYRELYSKPDLQGPKLVLEFELRLPVGRDPAGALPDVVELVEGDKNGTRFPLSRDAMRVSEGRIIISGMVPLKKVSEDRLLTFPHNDNWHAIFTLLLNGTPIASEFNWSDWQPERISTPGQPEAEQFQIRYRVQAGSSR